MPLKILLLSRNLPPLIGGMERLSHRLHDGLATTHEVTLVGPSGCAKLIGPNFRTIEIPKNPLIFTAMTVLIVLWLRLRGRYDVCIGANGLMAPACLVFKKAFRAPAMVLVHGLDLVVHNALYQNVFVRAMRTLDSIVANSRSTRDLALARGIPADKLLVINPGVDYPPVANQPVSSATAASFAANTRTVLFVGRIVRRKGLSQFIERCMPTLVERHPDIQLMVVGDSPQNSAVRDPGEMADVKDAVARGRLENKVAFLGKVPDADLQTLYRRTDVLILPLIPQAGDIEGFGMVILEAASYGAPTVAFSIGGVADAIVPGETGHLITEGDYSGFCDAVSNLLSQPHYKSRCLDHAQNFRWENYNALMEAEILKVRGSAASGHHNQVSSS